MARMREHLRDKWDAAGYGRKMGSACVVPPPPKGIRRVYHLTSADFAVSNIALGRMKVARFSDLNDPFELLALNFGGRTARRAGTKFKTDFDSQTGLLCFSRNWTSPVLWSHYGNRHRGICLGFDIEEHLLETVRYESERLLRSLGDGDPDQLSPEDQTLLRCTKYEHWYYEEELRHFVSLKETIREGTLNFYPFGDKFRLMEVILGHQCDLSLDAVRRLAHTHYRHVTTFKARLAFKSFAVVPNETTVPLTSASYPRAS
jgi:hypothetical protein